jgi:hypothetical protein
MLDSLSISLAILRTAALLVPCRSRQDWLAEWRGELWHVCRAYGSSSPFTRAHGQKKITQFCLGAFADAFALRLDGARSHLRPGTPRRLTLTLASLLLMSFLLCLAVPAIRDVFWASSTSPIDEVALISSEGHFDLDTPSVRFADYQAWKDDGLAPFRDLVFYRPATAQIHLEGRVPRKLRVGYASSSLMKLLPSSWADTVSMHRSSLPIALLSSKVWRQDFDSDPNIAGRTFYADGHRVTIAGIATSRSWPIPGDIDVLLVEQEADLAQSLSSKTGFVLAPAIQAALHVEDADKPYILVEGLSGTVRRFECLTLAQRRKNPVELFLFSLLVACLALPATTPLPLGDYPEPGALTLTMRIQRWLFLIVKLVLIMPTAFLFCLFVADCLGDAGTPTAAYLQMVCSFTTLLFSFRWALQDQRRRCPTCLCLLSHPVMVGHFSRSFLAWSGTELLCASGHGFLHIPEHPTSWFSTQRWLSIDSSWTSHFTEEAMFGS